MTFPSTELVALDAEFSAKIGTVAPVAAESLAVGIVPAS